MRLHWKRASMMHKDGHHQMKHKHFRKMMMHSMFDDNNMSCKKKHFKRMMKNRSMMAPGHHGRWRHLKGHSSSDSDDSDQGKGKPFKHMLKHCSPAHHGKFKHSRGRPGYSSSSDSDDHDHHHGYRRHFMGTRRRCRSMSPFGGHHGKHFKGVQGLTHSRDVSRECMSSIEKSQCPKDTQGQSMSHSVDVEQGNEKGCMSSTENGQHSKDNQGQSMGRGSAEKGHQSKGIEGQSRSGSDGEEFQRYCMSDNGRKHHKEMGKRGGCMTDLEDGHHGKAHFRGMRRGHVFGDHDKGHFKGMRRGHMFGDHGKAHFKGMHRGHMFGDHDKGHKHRMMHHFKGKYWMKGHDKSGFGEDSALVPICAIDVENPTEKVQSETTGNQTNDAAETGIEDTATTREQGTQTTAIMEIVIEDQEAQNAAISIVNKFL